MKQQNPPSYPIPSSVYRLQLSANFPLKKVRKILPYLRDLGVQAIYFSPYFKAYSEHGYDVTDPNALNPQLGTLEEFYLMCKEMKALGLMHIADVVPNHMGLKGGQNFWWQDVLENGPYSEFAFFFDINWSPEKRELQDRVLLPILGDSYGKTLENQEITLTFEGGRFLLHYSDFLLPVALHSYAMVLENELDQLKNSFNVNDPEWKEFYELIELYRFFPVTIQERAVKKEEGKERLLHLYKNSRRIRQHLVHQISLFNGKKRNTPSFDLLHKFLEAQFYRLSYWRVASHEINYRRFFNVNELVSIRIEEERVLENHHLWIFQLLEKGIVDGIRIDHPDGLYDPMLYFATLRKKKPVFTVVEKILEWKEKLPKDWDVDGTVGYEFINLLSGLFIMQENESAITEAYESFIGQKVDFEKILYDSKKFFTNHEMVSDVEALGLKLDRLSETSREYRDFTRHELTQALAEVIACFPVYRSYIQPSGTVSKRDKHYIRQAIQEAKKHARELEPSIFDFIENVLLLKAKIRPDEEGAYREFVLRFQQLTAPIMAKGLEDTSFYIYNRLISLNEVGGSPPKFGHSLNEFHTHNKEKKDKWPYGFLASSSHDTKRSEDVRMRLQVLSEIPEKWNLEVRKWSAYNSKFRQETFDLNTEYFIYQTLLGVWPTTPFKKGQYEIFCERVWKTVLKSIREAKQKTSWMYPNPAYEEAVKHFYFSILTNGHSHAFLYPFFSFVKMIDRYGSWNSLSQAALKIGAPGVVDIYQENERLTYKLVDPDNRSTVPFDLMKKKLKLTQKEKIDQLFASQDLSQVKLMLHKKALHFRNSHPDLFLEGEYIPLKTRGARKDNLIAFMRKYENKILIVLAGRFFTQLAAADWDVPLGLHAWGNTEIILPTDWKQTTLTDLFTEQTPSTKKRGSTSFLSAAQVFNFLPFSYLYVEV
jgi:(1->4)-alpha-D-glucan 1-alpha-D-glucosylmutase